MLFSVKRTWATASLALAILLLVSGTAKLLFDISWNLKWQSSVPQWLLIATLSLATSDGLVHVSLIGLFTKKYLQTYKVFARYFDKQSVLLMAMGGIIASAEELFFRGVVQESLSSVIGVYGSVACTSILFGACHTIPRPDLKWFAIWAVWESIILGTVYAITGSLLVNCILHAMHDFVGFVVLRLEARRGT